MKTYHNSILTCTLVVSLFVKKKKKEMEGAEESANARKPSKLSDKQATNYLDPEKLPESLRKRFQYKVMLAGKDVTPKPLSLKLEDIWPPRKETFSDISDDHVPSRKKLESPPSSHSFTSKSSSLESIQHPLSESVIDRFREEFLRVSPEDEEQIPVVVKRKASKGTRLESALVFTPQSKVTITLRETPTFHLFEMPSITVMKDSKEAEAVQIDNLRYDYLTIGEGCRRYQKTAEIQTISWPMKNKAVQAILVAKTDASVMATTYDLYQSFEHPGLSAKM